MNKWAQEEAKLTDGTTKAEYFQPKANAVYEVTFLDEGGEPYEVTYKDGETKTKVAFKTRVTGAGMLGKELLWTVTKGSGRRDGLYGKLVTLFARRGTATGLTVQVLSVGEGTSRRYTLPAFDALLIEEAKKGVGA